MFGQQNKIKELLEQNGWELIDKQIPIVWWIAETWLIKSKWSPTDCYISIDFQVDEELQDRTQRKFAVWAIKIALTEPSYWRDDNPDFEFSEENSSQIPIRRNWEHRISQIFEELDKLRLKYSELTN